MNNIYLIVAPSGAGKTTVTELLESKYGLKPIQSYTTRPPRFDGETGHTFVLDEEFDKLTDIVVYTEFAGNRYCATAEQVEENDLYVIDPKGVEFFKEHYSKEHYNDSKQVKIIYIESDMTTRYERMKQRAEDSGSTYLESVDYSLKRIVNDVGEFYDYVNHRVQVDCIVENNNDTTIENVADKIYKFIVETEEE